MVCRARTIGAVLPMVRTLWGVLALAPVLLLAACVTGAAPSLPPVPAPMSVPMREVDFAQVAIGEDHLCGLKADGVAVCWGNNHHNQTNAPEDMRFRQLTAGSGFTCGLGLDGVIACWGRNAAAWPDGQAGTWEMVSAGRDQLCALDARGVAACWGSMDPPPEEGRYTAIGTGDGYGCGLTPAGAIECWGRMPTAWPTGSEGPFTALSVGLRNLCALRPDGTAFCQGPARLSPPDTAFTQITTGYHHACGLTGEGAPVCWGSGETLPDMGGPVTALATGWERTCGLRPGRGAICWRMFGLQPLLNAVPAFNGRVFDQPVELFPWPGGGLAVVERRGTIGIHDPDGTSRPALDLSDRTVAVIEQGLLGAALDPRFDRFPFLYVYYNPVVADGERVPGRLSRFPVVDGRVNANAELIILEIALRSAGHNGGALRFGPDGMLYLGIGKAGKQDAPQSPDDLLGKIVRIDVRGATAERPYRIPPDNPFVGEEDAHPEIWARGLRQPWRMGFDAEGRLWVGDVGEGLEEELSLVTPGANLGWPVFEGTRCNEGERACAALADAVPPAVSYGRGLGCAIIAGVQAPAIGAYLFGDFCSGRIWALEGDAETGWSMREIARAGRHILAFGRGADGEVYALTRDGPILRLEAPP